MKIQEKIDYSIALIRKSEPVALQLSPEGFYLAFSGGKDSQVIYHLAKEAGVKFKAHMNLTSVDPPDVVRFVRDNYPDVQLHKPKVFPNTYLGRFEADIFEVTKSGYLYEYEVKISRSDFFSENKKIGKSKCITDGKRCNYFYYLVPKGLIKPDEIPEYAGLIYVNNIRHTNTRKMGNYGDHPDWSEPRLVLYTVKLAPKLSSDKLGEKYLLKLLESTYRRFHNRIRDKYLLNNNKHENI